MINAIPSKRISFSSFTCIKYRKKVLGHLLNLTSKIYVKVVCLNRLKKSGFLNRNFILSSKYSASLSTIFYHKLKQFPISLLFNNITFLLQSEQPSTAVVCPNISVVINATSSSRGFHTSTQSSAAAKQEKPQETALALQEIAQRASVMMIDLYPIILKMQQDFKTLKTLCS